jgi:hypothetical protein
MLFPNLVKFAFQLKFLVARNVKCGRSLHSNESFWLQEL